MKCCDAGDRLYDLNRIIHYNFKTVELSSTGFEYEEKFNQDSYNEFHSPIQRLEKLTCVIGAKCNEGCIILADRRVLRSYEATEESKIQVVWGRAAMAGAGVASLLDKFGIALNKSKIPATVDFEKTVEIIEDIVSRLRERYQKRLQYNYKFQAIIMGLKEFDTGDPYIKLIHQEGMSEDIKRFYIIGHGAPYVSPLFSMLYDPALTLTELAVLGFFSMSVIDRLGLDQTMESGRTGPDIVVLRPDQEPDFLSTSDDEFSVARNSLEDLNFKYSMSEKIWLSQPEAYKNIE